MILTWGTNLKTCIHTSLYIHISVILTWGTNPIFNRLKRTLAYHLLQVTIFWLFSLCRSVLIFMKPKGCCNFIVSVALLLTGVDMKTWLICCFTIDDYPDFHLSLCSTFWSSRGRAPNYAYKVCSYLLWAVITLSRALNVILKRV